jgi:hypothetical protein
MLKLDFDLIHDISKYKNCWLCNNIFIPETIKYSDRKHTIIVCKACCYGLSFEEFKKDINMLNVICYYIGMNLENSFFVHADDYSNNKLNINFPIDLDCYMDIVGKRIILL